MGRHQSELAKCPKRHNELLIIDPNLEAPLRLQIRAAKMPAENFCVALPFMRERKWRRNQSELAKCPKRHNELLIFDPKLEAPLRLQIRPTKRPAENFCITPAFNTVKS
jgi:hypothetical protein